MKQQSVDNRILSSRNTVGQKENLGVEHNRKYV